MPALSSSTNPGSAYSHSLNLHPFRRCADEEVEPEMLCPLCDDALDHAIELTPCGDMFCLACLEAQQSTWHNRLSISTPLPGSSPSAGGSFAPAHSSSLIPHTTVAECPKCSQAVREERVPTRVLLNLLLNVRVRCSQCGWEGTREAAEQHGCCDAVREANAAVKAAYDIKKQEMTALQKKLDAAAAAATSANSSGGGGGTVPQIHALPLPGRGAGTSPARPPVPTTTVVPVGASGSGPSSVPSLSSPTQLQQTLARQVTSGSGVAGSGGGAPLNGVRRADDTTDSALLRNFQTIEDDPSFSTVRRQRRGGSGTGSGSGSGGVSAAVGSGAAMGGLSSGSPTSSNDLWQRDASSQLEAPQQQPHQTQQTRAPHSPSVQSITSPLNSSYDGGYYHFTNTDASSLPTSHITTREVITPVQSAVPLPTPPGRSGTTAEIGQPQTRTTHNNNNNNNKNKNTSDSCQVPYTTAAVVPVARASLLAPPQEGSWQRYGMTQAEYDQVMGIFLSFDTDGVGRLNRTQMFQLCVCLNYVSTREDLDYVFEEIDQHHTGFITLDQFCLWLRDNRPDPDALYGLTPFEYNDSMIQFRVADPTYRGWTEWKDFCQLCLRNRYASTTQDAQMLFQRCADPASKTINLHRYFKLLQSLKQQGFTIGGRSAESRGASDKYGSSYSRGNEAFPSAPDGLHHRRGSGSSLTTPPVGPYKQGSTAGTDVNPAVVRGSVTSSGSLGGGGSGGGIPRPPPRSSPVTGQVISGGRASHGAALGASGNIPRLQSNASSIDRANSTLMGSSGMLSSPLDGGMVASGGRSTSSVGGSVTRGQVVDGFQRGGKRKNDCTVM